MAIFARVPAAVLVALMFNNPAVLAVLVKLPVPDILTSAPVVKASADELLTVKSEPDVRAVVVWLILTALPVVKALAVTFRALPAVVLTEVRFSKLAAPVVLEPVKLTTLPV